jgi:hypothetical protein
LREPPRTSGTFAPHAGKQPSVRSRLARLRAAYRQASPAQRIALQAPKRRAKERRAILRQEISALQRGPGSDSDRVQTLAAMRNAAATLEQAQLLQRLVQRVDYDGRQGKLAIVLRQHEAGTPRGLSA